MIANKLPKSMRDHGPFRARFYRVRFSSTLEQLKEDRLIATLYGCMVRRICQSPYINDKQVDLVPLRYNKCIGTIVPVEEDEEKMLKSWKELNDYLSKMENQASQTAYSRESLNQFLEYLKKGRELVFLTNRGKMYRLLITTLETSGGVRVTFEIVTNRGEACYAWGEQEEEVALLDYACVPLKKPGEEEEGPNRTLNMLFRNEEEEERNKAKTKKKQDEETRLNEDTKYDVEVKNQYEEPKTIHKVFR